MSESRMTHQKRNIHEGIQKHVFYYTNQHTQRDYLSRGYQKTIGTLGDKTVSGQGCSRKNNKIQCVDDNVILAGSDCNFQYNI